MTLVVPRSILASMASHAEQTYPEECCGFMIGFRRSSKDVLEAKAAVNVAPEMRTKRYSIDPRAIVEIEARLEGSGKEILGFYHSHPDAPPQPSQYDLENSWPIYSYVILSLKKGKLDSVRCWRLSDDGSGFVQEQLISI